MNSRTSQPLLMNIIQCLSTCAKISSFCQRRVRRLRKRRRRPNRRVIVKGTIRTDQMVVTGCNMSAICGVDANDEDHENRHGSLEFEMNSRTSQPLSFNAFDTCKDFFVLSEKSGKGPEHRGEGCARDGEDRNRGSQQNAPDWQEVHSQLQANNEQSPIVSMPIIDAHAVCDATHAEKTPDDEEHLHFRIHQDVIPRSITMYSTFLPSSSDT